MAMSWAPNGNIYLSPHHDDIAFSLGARIAAEPGGRLVNVFTRSGYVAGAPLALPPDVATIERVTTLRVAEDMAFAERFRLERIDLGLEDAPVHGRSPWDLDGLADDIVQVRAPLAELLRETEGARVFCPAAIGGHVNHLAVRAVVIELLPELERRAEVLFYEDLPYASSSRARRHWLPDFRAALGVRRLRRRTSAAGPEKLAAVNLYPSQHTSTVISLRQFSPKTLWPIGPHEAVWRLFTAS
ncbi:PIG-L family deacetylase [Devosia sp. LjRoot16]|uniref:PIG-L deacetylase family protein n=1 Tax=Devosia sp. LjRoot16 TaxID=3342271 RepID=UPI003ECD3D5E